MKKIPVLLLPLFVALFVTFFIFGCSKKAEETKVTISLPKKSYIMYEPINLQFEWVNNTSKNDSIWGLFSGSGDFLIVQIKDQSGNVYNKKHGVGRTDIHYGLSYVIAPGDTLYRTYDIIDYGKKREDRETTPQFWCVGYLPTGKYNLTVIIDKDAAKTYLLPIKTNTVEFEVVEAGVEELEIKKMYFNDKEGKEFIKSLEVNEHENALKKFPNSKFDEHLRFHDIIRYIVQNDSNIKVNTSSKADTLLQKYDEFINRFPNSQYFLFDGFTMGMFLMNCNDQSAALRKKDQLIEKYPKSPLALNLRTLTKYNKLLRCN